MRTNINFHHRYMLRRWGCDPRPRRGAAGSGEFL